MKDVGSLYWRVGEHRGLDRLLHSFYADVRQHRLLGPIFNSHVQDWKRHNQTVVEFWARLTGGPSTYAGGMGKHMLLGIEPFHFDIWLDLWEYNCRRQLEEREADEMIQLARQIAARLKVMLGIPSSESLLHRDS